MKPLHRLIGIAAPFNVSDVDTDRLIPHRFVREPLSAGYGRFLLHGDRYDADGNEINDFLLNRPVYRTASILVTGKNFGCGSSREAAVIALADFGIRVVIAESFSDIFRANCLQNGVLPVRLSRHAVEGLLRVLQGQPGASMSVDLERQEVTGPQGDIHHFEIDASRKQQLLQGLDDINITLANLEDIDAFERAYRARFQWLTQTRTEAAVLVRGKAKP